MKEEIQESRETRVAAASEGAGTFFKDLERARSGRELLETIFKDLERRSLKEQGHSGHLCLGQEQLAAGEEGGATSVGRRSESRVASFPEQQAKGTPRVGGTTGCAEETPRRV